jgi:hypothetical protein
VVSPLASRTSGRLALDVPAALRGAAGRCRRQITAQGDVRDSVLCEPAVPHHDLTIRVDRDGT